MKNLLLILATVLTSILAEAKDAQGCGCRLYAQCREEVTVDAFDPTPFNIEDENAPNYWIFESGSGTAVTGGTVTSTNAAAVLLVSDVNYQLPGATQWQFKGSMVFEASAADPAPPGLDQDPQYGFGFLGVLGYLPNLDPQEYDGWIFGFAMTNVKIYAVYARLPTQRTDANPYIDFQYYIPIANRSGVDVSSDLTIVLDASQKSVSWRVGNFEFLFISCAGKPVDSKFLVSTTGGVISSVGFPTYVKLGAGISLPDIIDYFPHTFCQQTLFNACCDCVQNAVSSLCQYGVIQVDPPVVNLVASFENLSVTEISPVLSCYCSKLVRPCTPPPAPVCSSSSSSSSSCSSSSSSSSSEPCSSSSSSSSSSVCKPVKPRQCRHHKSSSSSSSSSSTSSSTTTVREPCPCRKSSSSSSSCFGRLCSISSSNNCPCCSDTSYSPMPICPPEPVTEQNFRDRRCSCSTETDFCARLRRQRRRMEAEGFIFPL